MSIDSSKDNYNKLFPNEKLKAEAFDKIAEVYYYMNFGSVSKCDFDTLMFSIYIERILEDNSTDFSKYSDYTLSKLLGITQSKISNLKVKKELLYPYKNFDWKRSFALLIEKAIYENERIKIYIPDKNLFIELKNAIENLGGFVEIQLNSNLLQVNPRYFLDLLAEIYPNDYNKSKIINEIIKRDSKLKCNNNESIGKTLLSKSTDFVFEIIAQCVPMGNIAKKGIELLVSMFKTNKTKGKGI